jgi:hypothetical protein
VSALGCFSGFEVGNLTLRTYIANNYQAIRMSSASISVREVEYHSPSVIATYGFGFETKVNLTNKTEPEIDKIIE